MRAALSTLTPRDLLAPLFFLVSALMLAWDVFLASRMARVRKLPRTFSNMTALAGFFIGPALLVTVASASVLTGRAIYVVEWLWPATLALFVAQTLYALRQRLVSPLIGLPIALYDVLLLGVALTRYLNFRGAALPPGLVALTAAQASALGVALGQRALVSPFAVQVPLLAPAYPPRWRLSIPARVTLAVIAGAASLLTALELPRGYRAVRSYQRFDAERLQERRNTEFWVGMRLYPTLHGGPPPIAVKNDLPLADSIAADVVSVNLDPEALTNAALDSLAHTVDALRRDSTLFVVALGYPRGARARFLSSPQRFLTARVNDVERITRVLRPDYLLPAIDPYGRGARELGAVPVAWWRDYLAEAAAAAHRVRPRTRIGVSIAAFVGGDSALYAWAAARGSPVDVVGFSFYPSYGGALALDARMRVADRWMRGSDKEHWIFAVAGYPVTHGEPNQARAIWGTLAWATSHRRIRGMIVETGQDYSEAIGLRGPGGRLRPAVTTIQRALRSLAETAQ